MILIGTGSEVQHLPDRPGAPGGARARPPGWCRCRARSGSTRRTGVPAAGAAARREGAGHGRGRRADELDRILGEAGEPVSIEHYGASAPAKILFEQFGFTADNVVAKAAALAKVGEITGHKTGN